MKGTILFMHCKTSNDMCAIQVSLYRPSASEERFPSKSRVEHRELMFLLNFLCDKLMQYNLYNIDINSIIYPTIYIMVPLVVQGGHGNGVRWKMNQIHR